MSSMDELDCVLWNFNTLARLHPGQRLSTQNEYLDLEQESIIPLFQSMKRKWCGDGRDQARAVINRNVNITVLISDSLIESNYIDQRESPERAERIKKIKKIIRGLRNAKNGINNLIETYKDDENTKVGLAKTLSVTDAQIIKLTTFLDGIGDPIKEEEIMVNPYIASL